MRPIPIVLSLCMVLALLVGGAAAQDDARPWPTDGWQVASPESQGMDSTLLADMLEVIVDQQVNIHSLVVVRNGYLVLEAYRYPYTAEIPHQINSATKSFTAALVGIAVEQGYIESVDQPVLGYFPDLTIDNLDAAKQSITLENLLTMSSGLEWSDELFASSEYVEMMGSSDWTQYILDRHMQDEPGTQFIYNSGGSNLLAVITEQATGQPLLDYARANLFDPLGIETVYWQTDPQGHYVGARGIIMTPRDMAKFGYLFLNNGLWDGQQLIPAAWVAASVEKHVQAIGIGDGYGYQWWLDTVNGYYMASGAGGQYIMVVPDQNLVVVTTAELGDAVQLRQRIAILHDAILPAIQSDEPLPENSDAQARLQAAIDTLANPMPEAVPPLPATAARISGQTYTFDDNALGFDTITLTFAEDESTAQVLVNGNPLEIGLDNRFHVNTAPGFPPIFARGGWATDNRFSFRLEGPGVNIAFQYTLTFDGQSVRVNIRNTFSGDVYSADGTQE